MQSYNEGFTIDYADYDKVLKSPFYPFSRDSEGGVAGFFCPAEPNERGNIIFNCSYTYLYYTKQGIDDGTYKYFENIIHGQSGLKFIKYMIIVYRMNIDLKM